MSFVWKPTTSCSAGPSDALASPVLCQNHPAQTDRNENNIRKLCADAAAACRTGRARHCWVCCHSWSQWRQIRGNSPLRRLRVLQTDMTAQVCEAPQCCVTSGILLWGKPAGSHWWIYFVVFHSEGVRSHQEAGTSPSMFSYTDVSVSHCAQAPSSWLKGAHLCNLEMTANHNIPFASINHWAK